MVARHGLCVTHLGCQEDVKPGSLFSATLLGTMITVSRQLVFTRKRKAYCNNSATVVCSWNIWCQLWLIPGKAGEEEELLKSWNLSQQPWRRQQGTGILLPPARAGCQFVVHMLSLESCFARRGGSHLLGADIPLTVRSSSSLHLLQETKFIASVGGNGSAFLREALASVLPANRVMIRLLFLHPIMLSCVKRFSLGWTHSTSCGDRRNVKCPLKSSCNEAETTELSSILNL